MSLPKNLARRFILRFYRGAALGASPIPFSRTLHHGPLLGLRTPASQGGAEFQIGLGALRLAGISQTVAGEVFPAIRRCDANHDE